jgi:hypothetical protein
MNNSKSILILFFIYFNVLNNTYSQGQNLHAKIDSLDYLTFATFLDTTDVTDVVGTKMFIDFFLSDYDRARLSYVMLFTGVFDKFLRKGLDLNPDNIVSLPIIISFDMSDMTKKSPELAVYRKKVNMFYSFLKIKQQYERLISYKYKESEQNILEEDIKNAVTYGLCSHPKIVTDILLSKYKHITREKISLETKH